MEDHIIDAEDLAARVQRLETVVVTLASRSLGDGDDIEQRLGQIDAELGRRATQGAGE